MSPYIVVVMIIATLVWWLMAWANHLGTGSLRARHWRNVMACSAVVLLAWLLIAYNSHYDVVRVRRLNVEERIISDRPVQVLAGRDGPIDVLMTFGRPLPANAVVEETELDPVVYGICFALPSRLLYEAFSP